MMDWVLREGKIGESLRLTGSEGRDGIIESGGNSAKEEDESAQCYSGAVGPNTYKSETDVEERNRDFGESELCSGNS